MRNSIWPSVQVSVRVQKLNIAQHGNANFVQNILIGKTDLINILKIVPVVLDTFTISVHKTC